MQLKTPTLPRVVAGREGVKGQGLALGRERRREAACKGGGRKLVGKLHPSDLIRRRAVLYSSSLSLSLSLSLSRFTFPSRRSFFPSATSASALVSVHSLRGKFSPLGKEGRPHPARPSGRPRPSDGRELSFFSNETTLLMGASEAESYSSSSPLLSSFRRRSHHCSALEISADNHV